MDKTIDLKRLLDATPRPHYLTEITTYNKQGHDCELCNYELNGTVIFSSEGHPSVSDRADKYLSEPHVNVGDCCFALWNATHVIAEMNGFGKRILRKKVEIVPFKIVPPDVSINLEVRLNEQKVIKVKNREMVLGIIQGTFYSGSSKLVKITANYVAERN